MQHIKENIMTAMINEDTSIKEHFDKDVILMIKKIFSTHKFKLINETIIHYTKFKIPLKYFFMKKSSQTHKHILIFRKNGIE